MLPLFTRVSDTECRLRTSPESISLPRRGVDTEAVTHADGQGNVDSATRPVKILLVHNEYQEPGGEDEVVEREKALLGREGHVVSEFRRTNVDIANYGLLTKAILPLRTIWSRESCDDLSAELQRRRPDVVHFHNIFPLISPAAYYTCKKARIPVVQTLHNPRLLCPAASFYRDGRTCEDCLGRAFAWPSVVHGCYRHSRSQSAVTAAMVAFHRALGTWREMVDLYVVSTYFYRDKFIAGGLPAERLVVKPHFLDNDPGAKNGSGDYALFVGRLTAEKGVPTLLEAWSHVGDIPLKIRGDGALRDQVERFSKSGNVQLLPRLRREELFDVMKGARFLIWPSEGYYETFGLVAIESFACGVPVITTGLGAMGEIVKDGKTGIHFQSGNAADLAAKVRWAWTHSEALLEMGRAARAEYEMRYTAAQNYGMLMAIYERAIADGAVTMRGPQQALRA